MGIPHANLCPESLTYLPKSGRSPGLRLFVGLPVLCTVAIGFNKKHPEVIRTKLTVAGTAQDLIYDFFDLRFTTCN